MKSEMIHYDGATGRIEAYLSRPDTSEQRPAVIVIHEIFGLVDHTKDVANRFVSQGYVTLAPHLFSGDENLRSILTPQNIGMTMKFMYSLPTDKMRDPGYMQQEIAKQDEERKTILQKTASLLFFGGLPKEKLVQDLAKAVDYLNSQSFVKKGQIGCVGFCFGGGMSINLACRAEVAASVIFYGENPSPIELVNNIKGSVLGIYGGDDVRINANLDQLVKAMAQYKKDFEMRIYPGAPHAFFNDTNKATFREQSAKDAWERVLRFYKRTLDA